VVGWEVILSIKRCFIDVETTGLDSIKNGIHQIAMVIEIDGIVARKEDIKVKPFADDIIVQESLDVSGVKSEDFKTDEYVLPVLAYSKIFKLLTSYIDKYDKADKFHFVGYNVFFDWRWMWNWFEKCGDDYFGSYFFYPPRCVMERAGWELEDVRPNMKNFKLHTVAHQLGMEFNEDKLHDAYYDIMLTRGMFYLLMSKNPDYKLHWALL
jgi:DNA polymerase-3 subunit epsilon